MREDETSNLSRTVKRMKRQLGTQPGGDTSALEARIGALESKVQGQALQIGKLRAALQRAGVQPEGE